MTDLKDTPGGSDSNAYVDEAYVDAQIIGWGSGVRNLWDDLKAKGTAPFDERESLIIMATRLVDQYGVGWGPRQKASQRLSFPRATDALDTIPLGVKTAVIEFIAFRVEGVVTEIVDMQAEKVTNVSTLGESAAWRENESSLPAGARRELDRLIAAHNPVGIQNRSPSGSPDGPNKFIHR